MPHCKQAAKRLRQSEKRKVLNRARISAVNTHLKRVSTAIGAKNVDAAKEEIRLAIKKIDKAAKKHTIHKNTAARRKSLLARQLAALAAAK